MKNPSPYLGILLSCALLPLFSCQQEKQKNHAPTPEKSTKIFPLLPVIEPKLWKEFKDAKATVSDQSATAEQRTAAASEAQRITDFLQKRHPFEQVGNRTTLGGIVFDKDSGNIEIPAVVHYPKGGDDRYPDELELILCSDSGRSHETLFTTDVRPLHLELLLHLAGYKKPTPASTFKISVVIPDHEPIPIEALIHPVGTDPLPEHLLWEFSGSDSTDPYLPDTSGDLIICWHANDSVLRIQHEAIASGEMKLKPAPHPALKQHQTVKLLLSPG